jgi:CspA family cold shock protein
MGRDGKIEGGLILAEGMVDKYSEQRGLGYILQDEGYQVLVERSDLDMPGYKTLTPGDRVAFEMVKTSRGLAAKRVHRLSKKK